MVKEIEGEYKCEECAYRYPSRELAEKCEAWCTRNHSCNLEITAQGTPPKENI